MGQKRTLSEWLTNRYLLIIRNEENFAEKVTFSFNYARLILIMALGFIISLVIAVSLVTTVLERWLDPRHAQMVANRQVIGLSLSVDSLQQQVRYRDQYIENVRRILGGEIEDLAVIEDDFEDIQQYNGENINLAYIDPVDSQFRAEYEKGDLGLVSVVDESDEELREILLFTPVEGIISDGFDPQRDHYGLDIVAKENEPIKAVADGIVILSSWTLDGGYVISVQHKGNLISVYKHNSEILKNVGNFVASGDIIAIIGNTGELTTGPHLHLELWHKGNPVNPEDYISF